VPTEILVEHLSKEYRLGAIGGGMLWQDLSRWWARFRGKPDPLLPIGHERQARRLGDRFWALDDVSFEVKEGEVLGIIGRNGAGKSTLLKIMSQVTAPTSGQIRLRGRVASLLEVGTGFHQALTGRENIFLNGAILGMTKAEIRKKFDDIVAFSECEEFIDTPVRRYSSGMYVRLAFAVAAYLESEILIVDEVLAVGDVQFQNKCLGRMKEISGGEGRTVLFVSHNMAAIQNLCTRCVLLKSGRVAFEGTAADTTARYVAMARGQGMAQLSERQDRSGSGVMRATSIALWDAKGDRIHSIRPNHPFVIEVGYQCEHSVRDFSVSIDIETIDGMRVTTLWSGFMNVNFRPKARTGSVWCSVPGLPLRPDRYSLNVFLGNVQEQFDYVERAGEVDIEDADVYASGRLPMRGHGAVMATYRWHEDMPWCTNEKS
jgi:lipopolysaccharide transport system ATP-binding protein